MEIINDLRADIVKLQAEIQSLKVQVAKPPVVNIDTVKLATVITDKLSDYTDAGNKVAGRIEAVAAKIPQELKHQYGINPSTRTLLIVVTSLVLAAVGLGYLATPRILEQQLVRQSAKIDRQAQIIDNREWEIEYYRSRNPRTAAQFDKEYRNR
jgi:hypothetical protein